MSLTVILDKSNYQPGELMTATVRTDPDERDVYHDEPIGGRFEIPGLGYAGEVSGTITRNTGTW